jgi:rhomboid protease GluP
MALLWKINTGPGTNEVPNSLVDYVSKHSKTPYIMFELFILSPIDFHYPQTCDIKSLMDVETQSEVDIRSVRYIVSADQLLSLGQADLNLPLVISRGFWSLNTHNRRLSTPSDTMMMAYCPQLIGPCCSPVRRRDYLRLLGTFTFWLVLTQFVMCGIMLWETKSPITNATVDESVLMRYGAISPRNIKLDHQYWRLLIGIFLHKSIIHLLMDVIIELFFMLGRESSWNIIRLLAAFVLSNLTGSFFSLAFSDSPTASHLGANNGLFGIFGAFVTLYAISFEKLEWKHRVSVLFFMIVNVVLLIFATAEHVNKTGAPGQAGGLGFGVFFGLLLFANRSDSSRIRILGTLIGSLMCSILLVVPCAYFFSKTDV